MQEPSNSLAGSRGDKVTLAVQTTVPASVWAFFKGQFAWLERHEFEVHTVCAPGEELKWITEVQAVRIHAIPMNRTFSPVKDLLVLWRLVRLYRKFDFTIVHAFTPKGGILGMLAATIARCPVRVFTIWGLAEESVTFRARLMRLADKVSCTLAHRVFVECPSIGELAVAKGICPREKLRVLPAWSMNSLDLELLNLTDLSQTRAAARRGWGLPPDALVLGFVGRVVRDKGVHELVEAFEIVAPDFPELHLLVVGSREAEDPIDEEIARRMALHARIHCVGFQKSVRHLLSAMDVLVHPSYREGLPTAPLEAAAIGLPIIATRIAGCIDAVQDGHTGLLVAPRDVKALAEAIRCYIKNPELRHEHGQRGRELVLREFDPRKTWPKLLDEYQQLLAERGIAKYGEPPTDRIGRKRIVWKPMTKGHNTASQPNLKLCRVVTVPQTFQTLLLEQLRCIVAHDIELTLVSSPGPELNGLAREVGARALGISMERQPAPLADLCSLFKAVRLLSQNRFDIVHSSTPKAGFITALAGILARVPVRVHTFTGQPWVELAGLKRRIAKECDRITAKLATQCYADSPSQRDFLIAEGFMAPGKIAVIGAGSISGVDLQRFSLATWGGNTARQTRRELGIPSEALVVVFVGRVTKDKGIVELMAAFEILAGANPTVHLLLVGPFEPERDPLPAETLEQIKNHPRVHRVGFSATPEKFLAAADIFCLPSYREGFGSVVVEAAAMELPAVVARVTGLVDAIVEGVTGLIVPPKNVECLAEALRVLTASKELRQSLGQAARQRVVRSFDARVINEAVVAEYFRLAHWSSS